MMWLLLILLPLTPATEASAPLLPSRAARVAVSDRDPLKPILDAGKRNLKWLTLVNNSRKSKGIASFDLYSEPFGDNFITTSPQTPESPFRYSNETLLRQFKQLMALAPPAFIQRISGRTGLNSDLGGLKESSYLNWAASMDYIYSYTCRWILGLETLEEQTKEVVNDLRGYLYFKHDSNVEFKLYNYALQTERVQKEIYQALLQLCRNSEQTTEECAIELANSDRNHGGPLQLYQKYYPFGEKVWNSHFSIQNARNDIVWNADDPNIMIVKFLDPGNSTLRNWIKEKIESMWHYGRWSLQIAFESGRRDSTPRVLFTPGITANTDKIGGNLITMDKNIPLDQEDTIATIQHEFGHVLGFPDCYIEFYDPAEKQMVIYSLNQENLMCNSGGKVTEVHFSELQRAYYQP